MSRSQRETSECWCGRNGRDDCSGQAPTPRTFPNIRGSLLMCDDEHEIVVRWRAAFGALTGGADQVFFDQKQAMHVSPPQHRWCGQCLDCRSTRDHRTMDVYYFCDARMPLGHEGSRVISPNANADACAAWRSR